MNKDDYIYCVKQNSNRLYRLALSFVKSHYDAEDIVQDVFFKLWKNDNDFENEEHVEKWLTKVCINKCKDYFKSPFSKHSPLDEIQEFYTFDNTEKYDIFNAIMSLPKKERIVVHLFYYEDMQIKEIAESLGIKESAVKTRLHRARKQIKEALGDDWTNE